MERPEIAQYTVLDFNEWRQASSLILTPKFQRREVWKTPARSYFIDSLLNEITVPPISIRLSQSEDKKKTVREIIDGQQRLRAVLDYIDDKYALAKSLDNPDAGKRFSEIDEGRQRQILNYSFICEVFKNISDIEVLGIFARVNTYSVGLNAQELRNGRYFGQFKQSAYSLALEHLEFWRRHQIFGEASIARMLEVEFTSELMVAQIAGQQDKKKILDRFYAEHDEVFPERTHVENRFRAVIDAVNDSVGDNLVSSEFHRPPLFYSLFCVIFHKLYGLPGENIQTEKTRKLTKSDARALNEAVARLSDKIVSSKQGEPVSERDMAFITACQRQTDNIKPRRIRFEKLYREAFR